MRTRLIEHVEQSYLKKDPPTFHIGDTIDVYTRIVEGDKERIQVFNGAVIGRQGAGVNERFIVRRTIGSEGVERSFLVHSPNVVKVEVIRRGKVRRAKLYYLRHRVGKARKIRELRVVKKAATSRAFAESSA